MPGNEHFQRPILNIGYSPHYLPAVDKYFKQCIKKLHSNIFHYYLKRTRPRTVLKHAERSSRGERRMNLIFFKLLSRIRCITILAWKQLRIYQLLPNLDYFTTKKQNHKILLQN